MGEKSESGENSSKFMPPTVGSIPMSARKIQKAMK